MSVGVGSEDIAQARVDYWCVLW